MEVDNPLYAEARDALARFAELVKSPEHIHTCRVTPLSIWNACAVGETADSIVGALRRLSKYPLPGHVGASVRDELHLKPSRTVYMSWGNRLRQPLRFSKSGNSHIEQLYLDALPQLQTYGSQAKASE